MSRCELSGYTELGSGIIDPQLSNFLVGSRRYDRVEPELIEQGGTPDPLFSECRRASLYTHRYRASVIRPYRTKLIQQTTMFFEILLVYLVVFFDIVGFWLLGCFRVSSRAETAGYYLVVLY